MGWHHDVSLGCSMGSMLAARKFETTNYGKYLGTCRYIREMNGTPGERKAESLGLLHF
jgi:hypothetical protein